MYFGIDPHAAVSLGRDASAFTKAALAKPFTIYTRWRQVFGSGRFHAIVITNEGTDLAELLVKNGLARIYGTRTPLPDGRNSRMYRAQLKTLEERARRNRLGGWKRA
jgi:endonuclease YncB( thermonuclease family)